MVFKVKIILQLFLLAVIFASCNSIQKCKSSLSPNEIRSSAGVPRKVYTPQQYYYREGKYTFIKGHYAPILLKRLYLKKSVRGYTSRDSRKGKNKPA